MPGLKANRRNRNRYLGILRGYTQLSTELDKISNDDELTTVARKAGDCLQAIQEYLGTEGNSRGKVRFPRGFIRCKGPMLVDLPQSRDPSHMHLNDCVSHAFMTADVFRWLLIRTDLKGLAQKMIIKATICLLGNICDSLTKDFLYGNGSKKPYKDRNEKLVQQGIIDEKLKGDLDWLWGERNHEHLWLVRESELKKYVASDYHRAHKTCKRLMEALKRGDADCR